MIDPRAEELLLFWFGPLTGHDDIDRSKREMWFGNGAAYDEQIRQRYGSLWQSAADGDLAGWVETARGRLALILLFDQLSRHLFRGDARAFSLDPEAQRLVLDGLNAGEDRQLRLIERAFFYLPLEHAEMLSLQDEAVRRFQGLAEEAPEPERERYRSFLRYAEAHREVIARFGHFPELNEILGRPTSDAEREFLTQPGYRFL